MKHYFLVLLCAFAFNAYAMAPEHAAILKNSMETGSYKQVHGSINHDDSFDVEVDGRKLKCIKDRYMNEIKCN